MNIPKIGPLRGEVWFNPLGEIQEEVDGRMPNLRRRDIRGTCGRGVAALAVLGGLLGGGVIPTMAQHPSRPQPLTVQTWSVEAADPQSPPKRNSANEGHGPVSGLLLLKNGSVLEGEIRRIQGGYVVRVPNGEVTLQESQVDAFCRTLQEAYHYKRGRLPVGDAKAHLELALWCLRYHLLAEAAAEMASAEELSPQHPMLPLLRRRLQVLEQASSVVLAAVEEQKNHSIAERVSRADSQAKTASEVQPALHISPLPSPIPPQRGQGTLPSAWAGATKTPSLSPSIPEKLAENRARQAELEQVARAMPPGSVQKFTQVIQPIITHYCGTARCHGGNASEGFRWLRVPGGMPAHRLTTHENLRATLELIDWEEPANSPLLRIPLQPHGGLPAPVFASPQISQYQELVNWVYWVTSGQAGPGGGRPTGESLYPPQEPVLLPEAVAVPGLEGEGFPPEVEANSAPAGRNSGPGPAVGNNPDPLSYSLGFNPGSAQHVGPEANTPHPATSNRISHVSAAVGWSSYAEPPLTDSREDLAPSKGFAHTSESETIRTEPPGEFPRVQGEGLSSAMPQESTSSSSMHGASSPSRTHLSTHPGAANPSTSSIGGNPRGAGSPASSPGFTVNEPASKEPPRSFLPWKLRLGELLRRGGGDKKE